MSCEDIKKVIVDFCNDLSFEYQGKQCGVTIFFSEKDRVYQAWNGDNTRLYIDDKELLADPFFNGKSLKDLSGEVQFQYAYV